MIKSTSDMSKVKRAIAACRGEEVSVKVALGRNKFVTYSGTLTSVYPALFTVRPDGDFKGKTSFSYAEVMCGNVRLKKLNRI